MTSLTKLEMAACMTFIQSGDYGVFPDGAGVRIEGVNFNKLFEGVITAYLSRSAEAGKQVVKGLEWEKFSNQHGTQYRAQGIFGWLHYICNRDEDGHQSGGWFSILGTFDTLEAAKAAAQANYEARIRSALSTPADIEPVGYVSVPELGQLKMGVSCVDLFSEPQSGGINFAPVYAAPVADKPVSVPEGWQLVPKEATNTMMDAFGRARVDTSSFFKSYRAMLAAAPQPNPSKVDAEVKP